MKLRFVTNNTQSPINLTLDVSIFLYQTESILANLVDMKYIYSNCSLF